jgi:uncharacterized glyoxalase superfamily protein PhnB
MILKLAAEPSAHPPTHVPCVYVPCVYIAWVYVDDITGHYERAKTGGAMIVTELRNPWGLPFSVAGDPEGNP